MIEKKISKNSKDSWYFRRLRKILRVVTKIQQKYGEVGIGMKFYF